MLLILYLVYTCHSLHVLYFLRETSYLLPPVNEELKATGKFELMDLHVDEAEHSMEMHLPYLAKVFEGWVFSDASSFHFYCETHLLKKLIQVPHKDSANSGWCS